MCSDCALLSPSLPTSGRHAVDLDDEQAVFIDRDPEPFKRILNWLRDPNYHVLTESLKKGTQEFDNFIHELKYYGIRDAVLLPPKHKGYLYAVGGLCKPTTLDSMERFDPEKNLWEKINQPLLHKRRFFGMCQLDDHLYACGGFDGSHQLASVERYNLTTGSWEQVASLTMARSAAQAAALNGKVYVIGGYNGTDTFSDGGIISSSAPVGGLRVPTRGLTLARSQ